MPIPVTNFCLYMDGNAWCAVGPGFYDIASSPCGFGDTQADAVSEFDKARRDYRMRNWPDLKVSDFVVYSGNPRD